MRKETGSWGALNEELQNSFKEVLKPTYIFYWLGIIVLFGGIGIWISIGKIYFTESQNWIVVFHATSTYSIAILAASMADINLSKQFSRSLQNLSFFIIGLGFLSSTVIHFVESVNAAFWIGLCSCFMSYLLWFLANADNEKLKDKEPQPSVATGGDLDQDLPGSFDGIEI